MIAESIAKRMIRLEKFFGTKKPKEMNYIQWSEKLYEMQLDWEEENQKEFPICRYYLLV